MIFLQGNLALLLGVLALIVTLAIRRFASEQMLRRDLVGALILFGTYVVLRVGGEAAQSPRRAGARLRPSPSRSRHRVERRRRVPDCGWRRTRRLSSGLGSTIGWRDSTIPGEISA